MFMASTAALSSAGPDRVWSMDWKFSRASFTQRSSPSRTLAIQFNAFFDFLPVRFDTTSLDGQHRPYPSHWRNILTLAIPAMLALASVPSLNIGDTAMIGRFGVGPIAARAGRAALAGGTDRTFAV